MTSIERTTVAASFTIILLVFAASATCSPFSYLVQTMVAAVGLLRGNRRQENFPAIMDSLDHEAPNNCRPESLQGGLSFNVPLPTPWSCKVDPQMPLPEYPRPQMQRKEWQNLNGIWEVDFYGSSVASKPLPFNVSLSRQILVPFPVEAPLSGVGEQHVGMSHILYRRTFTVPPSWSGRRVLLHFGAVDWEATVYVNQHLLGVHRGGYDKFHYDVTDALGSNWEGTHELLVATYDPTEFAHIPIGKQRLHPPRHPSSIWYTSNSGIWQTVWLEPVSTVHITRLDLIPDIDTQQLIITVQGSASSVGWAADARAFSNGSLVATASGVVGEAFAMAVPNPHLWSPDDPFLYDIEVSLLRQTGGVADVQSRRLMSGATVPVMDDEIDSLKEQGDGGFGDLSPVDTVRGYFGMRKVSLGRLPGEPNLRVFINNEFLFQMGMLDQGYWPDGIYTAPTDDALVSDIVYAKSLGYNMLRKHIKVEPDRWYYHADRLGLLVWQDMPAMFFEAQYVNLTDAEAAQWKLEATRMIEEHLSFPSIITWVIFNEAWGQFDTVNVVKGLQPLDPSRLFDCASGWVDAEVGDLIDMHRYVGPDSPLPTLTRAAVLGEFGGLGWRQDGHMWIPEDTFCYEIMPSLEALEVRYLGLVQGLKVLMQDPQRALSAAVYTEVTDVEAEVNGWMTYDRQFSKTLDPFALPAAHRLLIETSRRMNFIA